jgi:hypothetical protein
MLLDPEIQELNHEPNFATELETFNSKNAGRLVSRFLLSFVDENALNKVAKVSATASTE